MYGASIRGFTGFEVVTVNVIAASFKASYMAWVVKLRPDGGDTELPVTFARPAPRTMDMFGVDC